ncbi:hypothetical protein LOK46_21575 [Methylobacterium sp. NMS14P]|uniref:hypothetical protein n=1 Tax=Methylobacterium sp. NMS14P TaxID=2894310 RepID=UPI0023587E26|nr:hypothetical protein [Methylobacterium sp. NMS14P]WCS23732.1 hypothetical protein LOK46_21575 [Methylobacterium sp. NMS14P]
MVSMTRMAVIQESHRTIMQEARRRVAMQTDPDFGDAVIGAFKLVEDAYARGVISPKRRGELLELLANDGAGLFEVREYEKPRPDPTVMSIGVFLEPTAAFLNELGLSGLETTSLEQASSDTDVKR